MNSSDDSNSAFQKEQEAQIIKTINTHFQLAVEVDFGKVIESGYSFHFDFANTIEKHHAKTNI